jgi:hypothetical protein
MDASSEQVDSEEGLEREEMQAAATGAGTTACDGSDRVRRSELDRLT